tara:strand:+ start:757 stop:1299 length:543 start_codon:yes stop_codon:yes gene_type:complete
MKKILLFFYILIILYIGSKIFTPNIDKFESLNYESNNASIDDSYGKVVTTYKNPHMHKNCCLVEKKFNEKKDRFEYTYKKLDKCNYSIVNPLKYNHVNLFIDGVNGWKNSMCRKPDESKDKEFLGSCKRINFECKDFMFPSQCKKFGMEWSDKTCNTPYTKPFKIEPRKIDLDGSKEYKV